MQPISTNFTDMDAAARRTARFWLLALLAVMALAAALAWIWTGRAAADEEARIYANEAQVADSRSAAVSDWVARQRRTVESIAANPSLVPYLASGGDAALGGYVENYMRDVAEREGFTRGLTQVPANVARSDGPGLAIVDEQGRVLIGIGGPLPPADDLIALGKTDMVVDGGARLKAGSALRLLHPLPAEMGGKRYAYGVRLLDDDVLARLAQPGETAGVAEQALIAQSKLGPVAVTNRGTFAAGEPLKSDPLTTATLAAAPRTADVTDSADVRFLVTSRPISGINWVLLRARPAGVLLSDTLSKRILTLTALLGSIGLTGALALLAWRQSVSARMAESGTREAQVRQFLETVSNSQPTGIYVIDGNNVLQFSNATAQGWPPLNFADLQDMIRSGRDSGGSAPHLIHHGGRRLRLAARALDPERRSDDILVVAEDLTDLIQLHEKNEASQRALVSTLTGLIDARDPASRGHSQKVVQVAAAIGAALQLDTRDIATLRTAGELMNLGKILVPSGLLTKSGTLSEDEKAQVRAAMAKSDELLAQVPFDGPVVATLDDLKHAAPATQLGAVLKLANSFVGQISPRAHRPALSADAALSNLRDGSFEAAHVSALAYWLDSQGGRAALEVNA
jgi:hypothetical protein